MNSKNMVVKYDSPQAFAETQRELLAMEREAEAERTRDLLSCDSEVHQLNRKVCLFLTVQR